MRKLEKEVYRKLLEAAKRLKLDNDSLRKENETLLLCLELTFEAVELWAKQQGFISSSGAKDKLEEELTNRKHKVRCTLRKLVETSEPAFFDGLLRVLDLPEHSKHLIEEHLLLGRRKPQEGVNEIETDMYGISVDGLEQIVLFHNRSLMEEVVAANPHMRILVGRVGSYTENAFPGVYIAAVKATRPTGSQEGGLAATQR